MKSFECSSDIGSVLIGNEKWTFAVPNIGGDGTTSVRVYESDKEFIEDEWRKELHFISSVQGTFGIYDYDCAYQELLRGDITINDALCVLNGRYGVYNGEWKVAFVKWEDFQRKWRVYV